MSTFSSAGEGRKEQLKKLGDLMDTCCFLDNKHGLAKAALFNVQKILEGNSGSGAGNNEGTDGHNPNVREVSNATSSTGSAVLRLPLQMKQLSL
jgi:hypothetical protein